MKFLSKTVCEGSHPARYDALLMPKISPLIAFLTGSLLSATVVDAQVLASSKSSQFVFKDAQGKTQSADLLTKYQPKKIVYPMAKVDRGIDPKLTRAATIAQERARAHSRSQCWRAVKEALLASGIISSYPKTVNAKEAGQELVKSYGFKKLSVRDPFKAPLGSVLVYGARRAPGHVEIRTKDGFASDFRSKIPSPRPLLGVYAKL
jgi:hypothetical protein